MMRNENYLRMTTEDGVRLKDDWNDLTNSVNKLASDSFKLAAGLGFGTVFFQWLSSFSALYLLILDRTNWKTNILTGLLVPYIFFSLPSLLFGFLRGQVGMCVAFIAVVLRLFFPHRFPDWLELPGAIILIIVVAPNLIADKIRDDWYGAVICLFIACYLLQEHIRASSGFRNSFTRANGISNSVGIVLLLAFPVWYFILIFL